MVNLAIIDSKMEIIDARKKIDKMVFILYLIKI